MDRARRVRPQVMRCSGRVTLALLCACCLALGGCSVKRSLDSRVAQIITALERQDLSLLKEVLHDDLYEQISPVAFHEGALLIKELGQLQDRRLAGLWLSAEGGAKATYVLTFPKGTLEMRLEQKNERVTALAWGGEGLDRAQAQLATKGFGRFLVREVAFLDGTGGKREPAVFLPGEPIRFRISAKGLAVKDGRAHFALSLMVVDELGKAVLDEPRLAQRELELGPADAPLATIEGALPALKLGAYSVQTTVIDLIRAATAEEKTALEVVAGVERQGR